MDTSTTPPRISLPVLTTVAIGATACWALIAAKSLGDTGDQLLAAVTGLSIGCVGLLWAGLRVSTPDQLVGASLRGAALATTMFAVTALFGAWIGFGHWPL